MTRAAWRLAVILLSSVACASPSGTLTAGGPVSLTGLYSYRVEASSGSLTLEMADVLFDQRSGRIEYIVVRVPLAGSDLDIRTAPIQSRQLLYVPWGLAEIDTVNRRVDLHVSADALINAPRFSPVSGALPANWRDRVNEYWLRASED